jgi:hypothetical protein
MWQNKAACTNLPSVLFFPRIYAENGEEQYDDGTIWESFGDTSSFYDEARKICTLCPVKELCLEKALERKERWGMWGGLSPIERRRIERKDRRNRLKEKRAKEVTTL